MAIGVLLPRSEMGFIYTPEGRSPYVGMVKGGKFAGMTGYHTNHKPNVQIVYRSMRRETLPRLELLMDKRSRRRPWVERLGKKEKVAASVSGHTVMFQYNINYGSFCLTA